MRSRKWFKSPCFSISAWIILQALFFSQIFSPFANAQTESTLKVQSPFEGTAKGRLEAGLEEATEQAFLEAPTYANYQQLTGESKSKLRDRVQDALKSISATKFTDFHYVPGDYSVTDRVQDLFSAAAKTRRMLDDKYLGAEGLHFVALGDTAALLTHAMEATAQKPYTYSYVAISRRPDKTTITPDQRQAYKRYLQKVLDPTALMRTPGRIVISDNVASGDTLRIFFELWEELAKEEGVVLDQLRNKVVFHSIEDEYKDEAEELRRYFLQKFPYPYVTQLVSHRLFRSMSAPERFFRDRWMAKFPPSEWTRWEELEPTLARPSQNAALTLFAFYEHLSELEKSGRIQIASGLEEGIRLPPAATEGRVLFLGPDVATPAFLSSLSGVKPAPGERQMRMVIFARGEGQQAQIEAGLEEAGLILEEPVIDIQVSYGGDLEAAIQGRMPAYQGLQVHVLYTLAGLEELGRFLQIDPVSVRAWQRSVERRLGTEA